MQEEIHKKIQSTEKEMRELSLSVERLHQEYQQLLDESVGMIYLQESESQ